MFHNIDVSLNELIPSDDDWDVIRVAVEKKVKEYCEDNEIDFDKVDYEYGVSVSINVFGEG